MVNVGAAPSLRFLRLLAQPFGRETNPGAIQANELDPMAKKKDSGHDAAFEGSERESREGCSFGFTKQPAPWPPGSWLVRVVHKASSFSFL